MDDAPGGLPTCGYIQVLDIDFPVARDTSLRPSMPRTCSTLGDLN